MTEKNKIIMENLFGYIKVGRLNKKIADKIGRKAADIFVEYNHLRHIENRRGEYLKSINLNALLYIKKIVDNFSEIREGRNDTLLLIAYIYENKHNNMAVIELSLSLESPIYLVKTAMPRRITKVNNEIILWQK